MTRHSVVDSLRWFLIPLSAVFSSPAWAEGFHCQHQTDGADAALVCSDDSGSSGDSVASVALRKMPRWGVHAGLTVIDVCIGPASSLSGRIDDAVKVDDILQPKFAFAGARVCERRYCTDVRKEFSLFINSIPFPIGWTAVSFWLGFEKRSFSIRCDQLVHLEKLQ